MNGTVKNQVEELCLSDMERKIVLALRKPGKRKKLLAVKAGKDE